jgi:cyclic lactone autoinducer peptide
MFHSPTSIPVRFIIVEILSFERKQIVDGHLCTLPYFSIITSSKQRCFCQTSNTLIFLAQVKTVTLCPRWTHRPKSPKVVIQTVTSILQKSISAENVSDKFSS